MTRYLRLLDNQETAAMRKAGPKDVIGAMILVALTAACAETTAPRDIRLARKQVDAHIEQCTARYGYDPETVSGLGRYSLGAGEREWRECVYEGVEKFLIPRTQSPELYRNAIAEDRRMTAAIASGKMTRSERRERMQKLIEEINRIEEANSAKRQEQSLDRTGKEDTQRLQEIMRRTLSPLTRP
jgi:hypothetical protein